MKKYLFSILSITLPIFCLAQITVLNNTFPTIGDTLNTMIDAMPDNIEIHDPGPDQMWDYGSLESGFVQQVAILDPSEGTFGDSIEDVTFLIKSGPVLENYYKTFSNKIEEIAFKTIDPVFESIEVFGEFEERPLYRKAPLSYGDQYITNSSIFFPFSIDVLPDSIVDQLPIEPDSIRIDISAKTTDDIDAWGSMSLPTGTFDVLREKRVQEINTSVSVFTLGAWVPIPNELIDPAGAFLGGDTTTSYNFYNDKAKELIAIVNVDSLGTMASRIEYKADNINTNTVIIQPGKKDLVLYPNPSYGFVRLDFVNLDKGQYRFEVSNVIGKKIWSKNYIINHSNEVAKEDLSFLSKGTYLFSLKDNQGKTLITKRLVIITP